MGRAGEGRASQGRWGGHEGGIRGVYVEPVSDGTDEGAGKLIPVRRKAV